MHQRSIFLSHCGGLTLARCQVPSKDTLSLHLLSWMGRENILKGSWIEIRTGRSLTNYCHGQNGLDLEKINLNLLLIKTVYSYEK